METEGAVFIVITRKDNSTGLKSQNRRYGSFKRSQGVVRISQQP